jgi:hypothetical protein
MAKKIHCKICDSNWHYQTFCPMKKQKWIKPESDKAKTKRIIMHKKWVKANPPDTDGKWECYLQISEKCCKRVSKRSMTKEHVEAKVRRPDLKYDTRNIRPSCSWCNKRKGSNSIEELSKIYPHLRRYLDN